MHNCPRGPRTRGTRWLEIHARTHLSRAAKGSEQFFYAVPVRENPLVGWVDVMLAGAYHVCEV